jgi:quercetin dioxygenase-like cupin family protein
MSEPEVRFPPSPFSALVEQLPKVALPYDTAEAFALGGADGAAVFIYFHEQTEVGSHRHGAQWGVVLQGQLKLEIGGVERIVGPGEAYDIPAGVTHGAVVEAGTALIDLFAEADRFELARRSG